MGGLISSLSSVAKPVLDNLGAKTSSLVEPTIDYALKSGWKVLEDSGPAGQLLSSVLRDQKTSEANQAGQFVSSIKDAWDGISDADRLSIHTPTPTPQATAAMKTTQGLAAQNIQAMSLRGAKVVQQGQVVPIYQPQDFFPKILASDVFTPGNRQNDLVDFLTTSGQLPTKADAKDFVDQMKGMMYGRKGAMVMHDMLGMQIPDQFLERDPKVAFSQWGDAAARYITKADYYGQKNQRLDTLIDVIGATNGQTAKTFASDAVNANEYGYYRGERKFYEGKAPSGVEDTIKNYEGLTHLSTIAIPHSAQTLNTLLLTDATSMGKALTDVMSDRKSATDFALKSGALLTETMRDFKAAIDGRGDGGIMSGALSNLFHYTGFDAVRGFNLTLSANAGKHYAMELADNIIKDPNDKEANVMLKVLGLEPQAVIRQGGLTPQGVLFAARRTAEMTQFIKSPLDLPIYWSKNPVTRTLTLYKNYIFNEGKFIKDFGFKQAYAAGKLPQTVAYMALLFPAVGELIGDTEMLAKGENPNDRVEKNPVYMAGKAMGHTPNPIATRYIDNLSRLGGIGMFMSMLGSFNHSSLSTWLGGPVAGDVDDMNRVGWQLLTGKGPHGKDSAKKLLFNRIPVVGNALGNKLYGKNN